MCRIAPQVLASLLALGASTSFASAQSFPDHTVRIIVPTAPGGAIDTTARIVAEKMQSKWGKPVIIENRPGASMRIGADAVRKAAPDGYTLLVAHDGTMAMNPLAFPDLPYDPEKDFTPLGLVVSIAEAAMVSKSVPVNSIAELIVLAKRRPGELTHASGGTATLLALELFKAVATIDIRSIPYRGGGPAVTAAIAGETSMVIADLTTGAAGLQSDRMRPLAITSLQRSKQYPSLPTMDEAGVKGYEVNTWMGFFGPAKMPMEVVRTIESAIKEALAMPDVRARFETAGAVVRTGTADEMRQVLATDVAKWAKLVEEKNIKLSE
jgi:tripartite-type tricarboxylate transporter receptor subunit TctC